MKGNTCNSCSNINIKIIIYCDAITIGYIEDLFEEEFQFISASIAPPSLSLLPPPFSINYSQMDKDTTVAQHNSRFNIKYM